MGRVTQLQMLDRPLQWRRKLAILVLVALSGYALAADSDVERNAQLLNAPPIHAEYDRGVNAFRTEDYKSARIHWAKAVDSQVRAAFNNLGYLLFYGMGGAAEPERAVGLWTTAAKSGDRESQWHLAQALEQGKGTPQNRIEAYAWYRCATVNFAVAPLADKTDQQIAEDAKFATLRIAATLSADEQRTANELASKFLETYPYSRQWLVK
jgi:hypothetical protein